MSIPPLHLRSDHDDVLPSLPPGRPRQNTPPKGVAAIYARAREPMMIERQFDQCEEYILDQGFILTESFHDISGAAAIEGRPGLDSMLNAAHRGEFGILVTDDVDRLIRDGAIAARIFAWTERHGIEIHTPSRGRMSRADVLMGG